MDIIDSSLSFLGGSRIDERLIRHMLEEMPGRADVLLRLNEDHAVDGVRLATKHV